MFGWLNSRIVIVLNNSEGLDTALQCMECHIDVALKRPNDHRALYHLAMDWTSIEPALHDPIVNMERTRQQSFALHIEEGQALGQITTKVNALQQALMIIGKMRGNDHTSDNAE